VTAGYFGCLWLIPDDVAVGPIFVFSAPLRRG